MEFANNKEHTALANPMSTTVGGGDHSNGSAVAYFDTSEPPTRPNGGSALADNDIDKGRMWWDTNFSPPVLKKFDGTIWEQAGNKVLNGTSFTSVNDAGDGEVALIRSDSNDNVEVVGVAGNEDDTQSTPITTGYQIYDINGTPTKVFTKYLTSTLDGNSPDNIVHGIDDHTKIINMSLMLNSGSGGTADEVFSADYRSSSTTSNFRWSFDSTNIVIAYGGDFTSSSTVYLIKIEYIL
jgi:hypothetical protein